MVMVIRYSFVITCHLSSSSPKESDNLHKLMMKIDKDNDNYDVRDAERSDAGQYYCRAENLVGSRDSDSARLSVHSKYSELFQII